MDSNLPPVQKLVIPAASSVPGSRAVSFRPTLTPGGLSRTLDRTTRDKTVSTSQLLLFYAASCIFLYIMQQGCSILERHPIVILL